jgi:hypothetical protein
LSFRSSRFLSFSNSSNPKINATLITTSETSLLTGTPSTRHHVFLFFLSSGIPNTIFVVPISMARVHPATYFDFGIGAIWQVYSTIDNTHLLVVPFNHQILISLHDWQVIAKEHNEQWQGKKVKVGEQLNSGKQTKTTFDVFDASVVIHEAARTMEFPMDFRTV